MTKTYCYELATQHYKKTDLVRFSNFQLRYLMARRMSAMAIKYGATLTVKRLTWKIAIKIKIKSLMEEV